MKIPRITEALGNIDDSLVASAANSNRKHSRIWRRVISLAACFCLIISSLIVFSKIGDNISQPKNNHLPKVPYVKFGNDISGVPRIYINNNISNEEYDMPPPRFSIDTVIEAKVTEVLPDVYRRPSSNTDYYIAKLEVVEEIHATGLPKEIYFRYRDYGQNAFNSNDRYIFSVSQIGIENFLMINHTNGVAEYFPDMFEVAGTDLIGYGSIIAFNDGVVDESFWRIDIPYFSSTFDEWFEVMLNNPKEYDFPATYNSTINEVKLNIKEIIGDAENPYNYKRYYEYITADDIFVSEEALEVKEYIKPNIGNVFLQTMSYYKGGLAIEYTRIINGFVTDEFISITTDSETCNVSRERNLYTLEDLNRVPDIGYVFENLELSEIDPPHIELDENYLLSTCSVIGWYRKVDGEIYGMVRFNWEYVYESYNLSQILMEDDLYYLYDSDCNGYVVERDELRAVIGNDYRILSFPYSKFIVQY